MDRRALALMALLVIGPAWAETAAPPRPAAPPTFMMTCWQNGTQVFSQTELTALEVSERATTIRNVRGVWTRVFSPTGAASGSLCAVSSLERLP